MAKVRLETAEGSFVAWVELPPFLTPPQVVIWGDRTFHLHETGEQNNSHDVYRECFAVVALGDAVPAPEGK